MLGDMLGVLFGAIFVGILFGNCPDAVVDPDTGRTEGAVDGTVDAVAYCTEASSIVTSMNHVAARSRRVMTNTWGVLYLRWYLFMERTRNKSLTSSVYLFFYLRARHGTNFLLLKV